MEMNKTEFEYWLYKDGQPPYIDTQFYLAEVGSKILFDGELYKVMEWSIGRSKNEDEMIIQCICEMVDEMDVETIAKSLLREQKINELLNGRTEN